MSMAQSYWQTFSTCQRRRLTSLLKRKSGLQHSFWLLQRGWFRQHKGWKLPRLNTPQRIETKKKRVCRQAQIIKVVGTNDALTAVVSSATASTSRQLIMEPKQGAQDQSASLLSAPPTNSPHNSTNQGPQPSEQDEVRRQIDTMTTTTRILGQKNIAGPCNKNNWPKQKRIGTGRHNHLQC